MHDSCSNSAVYALLMQLWKTCITMHHAYFMCIQVAAAITTAAAFCTAVTVAL
jgi:hypothetical protein